MSRIIEPFNSNDSNLNPNDINSIESTQQTNSDNSLSQVNITKQIEEINLINQTQKSKDKISPSELNEDEVDSGPIPPWIR